MFRKKKPKRLYLPAKSKWYTRPRPRKRKKTYVPGKKRVNLKRKVSSFKKQWLYWIIGSLTLLGLLVILFFSTYLQIADIDVKRHDVHVDSAAIQEVLKPYIGDNLLFFDRSEASERVQAEFVEYAQVHLKKVFPNTLQVELESHAPVFNLRFYYALPQVEEEPSTLDSEEFVEEVPAVLEETEVVEQKGLLNAAGQVVFNQEENLELLPIIIRDRTRPLEDREVVMYHERLNALQAAIERFEELFPDRIESVQYFPEGREVHLRVENGLMLWITFQKDPVEQIEKLYSIYQSTGLDQENLAYIDLRVVEKVIYCPRGTACDRPR